MNSQKRILLVDDDVTLAETVKLRLECEHGYEVYVESDSRRAVAAGRAFQPHCIVLDVVMPGLDGGDVATRFRRDPALREVPIAFLTGMLTEKEARARRGKCHEETFFAKPVNFEDLIQFIEAGTKPEHLRAQAQR